MLRTIRLRKLRYSSSSSYWSSSAVSSGEREPSWCFPSKVVIRCCTVAEARSTGTRSWSSSRSAPSRGKEAGRCCNIGTGEREWLDITSALHRRHPPGIYQAIVAHTGECHWRSRLLTLQLDLLIEKVSEVPKRNGLTRVEIKDIFTSFCPLPSQG